MATHATPATDNDTPTPDLAEINDASLHGWKFFTKFLLWNVVACGAILGFVALLTVWR